MKIILVLLQLLVLVGCTTASPRPAIPGGMAINAEATRLMAREDVQGMGVAGGEDHSPRPTRSADPGRFLPLLVTVIA